MHAAFTQFTLPYQSDEAARTIIPFFMPFAGCPFRCVFCAQDAQTGMVPQHHDHALRRLMTQLATPQPTTASRELAFYGGTFTALSPSLQRPCLAITRDALRKEQIVAARCSTRPDAVSPQQLAPLKHNGINLIELGVQSFQDAALALSMRGYCGQKARKGCHAVREAGFSLGIQLLPGMPGLTSEAFLDDVDMALSLEPSCMRFYPCLVLEGTVLADWWRSGRFVPWSLDETITTLGEGLKRAWKAGVPVIRVGLAPEPTLDRAFLAGPRHPALGSRVQGEALIRTVTASRGVANTPFRLLLPARCQGFACGHQGDLKMRWAELGLLETVWHEAPYGAWQPIRAQH